MLVSCYMQILTCIDYGVEVIQSRVGSGLIVRI